MHAFGIEDERFHFGFGTLSGDLLAFPRKCNSGGIADLDDDFAICANSGVGRRNQRFVRDALAIGSHGDPGVLRGTYYEVEGRL